MILYQKGQFSMMNQPGICMMSQALEYKDRQASMQCVAKAYSWVHSAYYCTNNSNGFSFQLALLFLGQVDSRFYFGLTQNWENMPNLGHPCYYGEIT